MIHIVSFKTDNIIENSNAVSINGKAEFIRDGKTVSIINSCDVYEFDDQGMIQKIYSYCITERKTV